MAVNAGHWWCAISSYVSASWWFYTMQVLEAKRLAGEMDHTENEDARPTRPELVMLTVRDGSGEFYFTVDRHKTIQEVMDMQFVKKKIPDPLYCKGKDGTIVQVESDKQFDYYMRPEAVRFELSRTKHPKRKRIDKECWASTLMRATSHG